MNIDKSKTISIKELLAKMNFSPSHTKENEIWYKSPFSVNEKTASFKVNENRWYCYSSGFGGYALDLIIKLNNCSVSEALQFLESNSFSFQKQIFETTNEKENIDYNLKIIPVQHLALIEYLKSRGITKYKNVNSLKEIHYSIKEKKYFALGFRNNSGGFEVRSKYAKICLGKKDISQLKNDSKCLRIFEGFFDYLSFIQKQKIGADTDYLILNSVALLNKNLSLLNEYIAIELYLDLDDAGNKYTKLILQNFTNAIDRRLIYKDFKDYNEWFLNSKLKIIDVPKEEVIYKRRR
jgi:Toprim-like